MPVTYGSQLEEHHCVRRHAGIFDVSHMTIVDLRGNVAQGFLRRLLANDVSKLRAQGPPKHTRPYIAACCVKTAASLTTSLRTDSQMTNIGMVEID